MCRLDWDLIADTTPPVPALMTYTDGWALTATREELEGAALVMERCAPRALAEHYTPATVVELTLRGGRFRAQAARLRAAEEAAAGWLVDAP